MGILNTSKPAPTDAERLAASMDAVAALEEKGLAQLRAVRDAGHDWFWDNPLGLTPQQMFAGYGTSAWRVVTQDLSTTDYVNANCPEGDARLGPLRITVGVPDAYVLTFNGATEANPWGDGSVTVKPRLYVLTRPGATVTLSSGDVATAGADGRAVFVVAEGDYTGSAALAGHDPAAFAVTLKRGGQEVRAYPTLITGPLTITGPAGAVVTVTPDAGGGEPTLLEMVPADEGDAGGSGAVNLVPGGYTISAALDGYADTPVHVDLTRDGLTVACGLLALEGAGGGEQP